MKDNHISLVELNQYLGFNYKNKKEVKEALYKFNCNPVNISKHRTKLTFHGYYDYNKKKIYTMNFNFEMQDLENDREFKYDILDLVTNGEQYYFIGDWPALDKRHNYSFLTLNKFRNYGNRYFAIQLNKNLDNIPDNLYYPVYEPFYGEDNDWFLEKHLSNNEGQDIFLKIESKRKSRKLSQQSYDTIHTYNMDYDLLPILDLGGNIGEVEIKSYFLEQDIPHLHIDSLNNKFHTCICLLIPKYFSHDNRFHQEFTKEQLIILNNYFKSKLPKNYYTTHEYNSIWKWLLDRWKLWNSATCKPVECINFYQPDYLNMKGWIM